MKHLSTRTKDKIIHGRGADQGKPGRSVQAKDTLQLKSAKRKNSRQWMVGAATEERRNRLHSSLTEAANAGLRHCSMRP